jgi:NADPH:quinone reductase-like Zn-dependent oxidoreductase
MKAIVVERYGRPDVLELRNVERPGIEDDQVLVRVHASSVNPTEWYQVTGMVFARMGNGIPNAEGHCRGGGLRRTRRGRRSGRHDPAAG